MKKQQPKYALHKATGQARVRINGKSIYLGPYDSEESRRRDDEIVADFKKGTLNVSYHKLTIAQLSITYVKYAKTYYVKNGRITSGVSNIQTGLRPLVKIHGKCQVSEFGPIKLKQVHELMVTNGIVRKSSVSGFRNFHNYRTRILFFCGRFQEDDHYKKQEPLCRCPWLFRRLHRRDRWWFKWIHLSYT